MLGEGGIGEVVVLSTTTLFGEDGTRHNAGEDRCKSRRCGDSLQTVVDAPAIPALAEHCADRRTT